MNLVQTKGEAAEEVAVAIPADLKRRLDLYIKLCPDEISGLGTIEARSGTLVVTGLYLLEQTVSHSETELSAASIAAFLAEAPGKGIDSNQIRLWWHSHAKSSTFWSATDEKAIESFEAVPWWVSIVGNHNGDYKARVDVFPNEAVPLRLTHPAQLVTTYVKEELVEVSAEIQRLVTKAPEPSAGTTGKLGRRVSGSSSAKKS